MSYHEDIFAYINIYIHESLNYRDSVQVEWSYSGRTIKLVDTAGLTRVRTDARLLVADEDRRKHAVFNSITGTTVGAAAGGGNSTRLPKLAPGASVSLPGIQVLLQPWTIVRNDQ
jgi:hypothetical protein